LPGRFNNDLFSDYRPNMVGITNISTHSEISAKGAYFPAEIVSGIFENRGSLSVATSSLIGNVNDSIEKTALKTTILMAKNTGYEVPAPTDIVIGGYLSTVLKAEAIPSDLVDYNGLGRHLLIT